MDWTTNIHRMSIRQKRSREPFRPERNHLLAMQPPATKLSSCRMGPTPLQDRTHTQSSSRFASEIVSILTFSAILISIKLHLLLQQNPCVHLKGQLTRWAYGEGWVCRSFHGALPDVSCYLPSTARERDVGGSFPKVHFNFRRRDHLKQAASDILHSSKIHTSSLPYLAWRCTNDTEVNRHPPGDDAPPPSHRCRRTLRFETTTHPPGLQIPILRVQVIPPPTVQILICRR
jgi:hypothetical protein